MNSGDWDDESDDFDPHDEHSQLDALPNYSTADTDESDLGQILSTPAISTDTEADSAPASGEDTEIPVAFASNRQGTVTVAAHLNGSVAQVSLTPSIVNMTEHQLAQEVQAVANVAAKKASAVIHVLTVQSLVEQGLDFTVARDFVAHNTWFTSPEDAQAAVIDLARRDLYRTN